MSTILAANSVPTSPTLVESSDPNAWIGDNTSRFVLDWTISVICCPHQVVCICDHDQVCICICICICIHVNRAALDLLSRKRLETEFLSRAALVPPFCNRKLPARDRTAVRVSELNRSRFKFKTGIRTGTGRGDCAHDCAGAHGQRHPGVAPKRKGFSECNSRMHLPSQPHVHPPRPRPRGTGSDQKMGAGGARARVCDAGARSAH